MKHEDVVKILAKAHLVLANEKHLRMQQKQYAKRRNMNGAVNCAAIDLAISMSKGLVHAAIKAKESMAILEATLTGDAAKRFIEKIIEVHEQAEREQREGPDPSHN